MAPYRASRAPRVLSALNAGLAWGPCTTVTSGRLPLLLGLLHTGPGLESAPAVVPNVRRPRVERDLQTGRSVQGTNGEWGAKMEQCNNKTNKLDEIHANSYEFHNASIFTHIHSSKILVKFVRKSYEFHVNSVQFANKESKHTSKHTLQSHGYVIDHAPLEHLGNRHAGAVGTRCHSVVGRTRGATPDMAKWISNSASTLSLLGHLEDREVGALRQAGGEGGVEGAGGGAGRDRLGGVGEEGLGSTPFPQPHPPNRPLPHQQHLVHAREVPAGRIPSNGQGLLGGRGPGAWC